VSITSRDELETHVRDVAKSSTASPVLAVLAMPDGSAGYIGLGRDEAVMFLHEPPEPAGFTTEWIPVVNDARKGTVAFFLLGEDHSEFEARSLLPLGDAIRALGDFFESGVRPSWIRWEKNSF
jgi:hypothetical protein